MILAEDTTNPTFYAYFRGFMALFLGSGLNITRDTLRSVGLRPLVQGVLLWVSISCISLAYIFWVG